MAVITDPDDLNQGVEVIIDETANPPTVELVVTGNLSDDGVTGQCLYSFIKEEWLYDSSLISRKPPFELMITPKQYEWINGWEPKNDTTRNLIRSAGWREINDAGAVKREYMNVISLGNIDSTDTAYYAFSSDTAKTDFAFPGPVNQAIQTFGDADNGSFDKRSESLTLYIRTQGKTYGSATSTSIGLTALNYESNALPLGEGVDSKITASDSTIATNAPYTGMSITYGAVTRTINGVNSFDVVVNGNNGTAEQIYEFVQYSLRQGDDIDSGSGTKTGELAESLMSFAGDTLRTATGVYIDGFNSNDTNRLEFTDTSGTVRTFPFVAAGTLSFNGNLVADTDAVYRMFFADSFGTSSALMVDDKSGSNIAGSVGGNATIEFDFDYDGNTQGGRTAGTDADVIIVATGLHQATYVSATATIGRATGQNISLVAPLERNFDNS